MLLFVCLLCSKLIDIKIFFVLYDNHNAIETANYSPIVEIFKLLSLLSLSS